MSSPLRCLFDVFDRHHGPKRCRWTRSCKLGVMGTLLMSSLTQLSLGSLPMEADCSLSACPPVASFSCTLHDRPCSSARSIAALPDRPRSLCAFSRDVWPPFSKLHDRLAPGSIRHDTCADPTTPSEVCQMPRLTFAIDPEWSVCALSGQHGCWKGGGCSAESEGWLQLSVAKVSAIFRLSSLL